MSVHNIIKRKQIGSPINSSPYVLLQQETGAYNMNDWIFQSGLNYAPSINSFKSLTKTTAMLKITLRTTKLII